MFDPTELLQMVVRSPASTYKSLVLALSSFVVLFSCSDLAGWWWHIPMLTSVIPRYATMKPNTAFCLALLAFATIGRMRQADQDSVGWALPASMLTATIALLVSAASLAEYITRSSFGLDQWLATVPMERFGDPAGRMSIGTSVCLVVTSAALLLLDRLPRLSTGLLLAGLVASFSGLVGFLFQAGPLVDVFWFKSLAVHTALGLLFVQVAALATRPERQPFRALLQPQRKEGNRSYLLFAVLLLPIALSLPILEGMQARLYDAHYAFALLVVLLVAIQTFILWADSVALHRVESVLRENDAESSRILQSIGDAVIVTDAEARVLRMNPLAEELTGWTMVESHRKSLTEVFAITSEETGQPVENPVHKVKRFGTVVGLANHTLLRHRDGHTTHVEDSSAPIRNEDGLLTGIVLVFRNVDERKESEARLLASDNKLRVALEAARLGAWELDLENNHMECSALCKANFGRSPEEPFSYRELLDSIHPEDRPLRAEALRVAVEELQVYRAEYRIDWADGSRHWIVSSGQVLTDRSGVPSRIVGVTMDVTERHRATAALMQSEKLAAVGRLASSIAHEINNPLESLTNLLYLIRCQAESPVVRDYSETAERELQRIALITTQTLRFHKQSTNPKAVTCEDLIGNVLTIYQGKIINARVTVEKKKLAARPVLCFEGEIRQVLSNLIGNALDAMQGQGGRLLLRSREGRDWRSGRQGVLITVADTGGGMSAKTVSHAFEPFYTTKGIAGTGLGLWISHEIVARHKGSLRLRSSRRPANSGTVFTLFLPWDAAIR